MVVNIIILILDKLPKLLQYIIEENKGNDELCPPKYPNSSFKILTFN